MYTIDLDYPMLILAIESSCDDTSVALVEMREGTFDVQKMKTASQIDVHRQYGGVVPEVAGRIHATTIIPLIEEILDGSDKPDYIAVTHAPGLLTGLLVGVEAAKMLSWLMDIPLIAVNHIEGHLYSVMLGSSLSKLDFPALALIVSGGHTEIIKMTDHGKYELIGKTRDDAAGECFDKVGKLIGIDYPGGPMISRYAESGDPTNIKLPRPMLDSGDYDFSFAGLKTAALYRLREYTGDKTAKTFDLDRQTLNNFCASFEEAVTDTLVQKTVRATEEYNTTTVILAGGVSANRKLRDRLATELESVGRKLLTPELKYTTDNAAMIAVAGYYKALRGEVTDWIDTTTNPNGRIYK
jgi:N6-L-threonylcarbamoyladenine synthase